MDQFSNNFGRMHPSHELRAMTESVPAADGVIDTESISAAEKLAAFKAKLILNKEASSGLLDKTSKLSSQERLVMQAKILGKSAIVSLSAINIALFTPIEFSFGKMTAITLNAMLFCLDKINEEDRKMKKLKAEFSTKPVGLKRLEAATKKIGALVGFATMAVLMGGFGSVAVGSAFTIQNSLQIQEEDYV